MKELLESLNDAQKKAVLHKKGPLLIIAGAGTGKTTVISRRIAYLISKKLAKPSEILALTFTDKAAGEMEERVDQLVPYGFVDTWISTFNAFGDRLLRDYAIDLGLPANFKVLSSTEQAIFFRENLYAFDLDYYRPVANPTTHIQEILKHFSRLKNELIDPESYLNFAKAEIKKIGEKDELKEAERTLELANAYQRYQDLMIQSGNLDYDDQIFLSYNLLKKSSKTLEDCRKKFKYILVDEFQDTNFAQYELVKLLCNEDMNITVVGDDDQSIYRFRGASISNILSFKEDFADTTEIVLNKNYRSTQEILDASYKLIQHNNPNRLEIKSKINKRLEGIKHGPTPDLLHCNTLSCEADLVANKIDELVTERNYSFNDFAILSRSNKNLEPFIQSLNIKGIPNIFIGSSSLFSRPEVKMLISFLKCLSNPNDNLSFFNLASSEIYGIDIKDLTEYYSLAKRQNRNFEEIFEDNISSEEIHISEPIHDIVKFREKINVESAGEILYEFITQKKVFKKLSSKGDLEAEIKITNIAALFDKIAQFEHGSSDRSVISFLDNLELINEVGDEAQSNEIDPDLKAVNLMSVHASKGLEWPVVFIVNMVNDRFPTRNRPDRLPIPEQLIKEKLPTGDFHLQEERRLFYVGATRAKDLLFLTSADDYGGKRAKKISQFVLEILDEANITKLKHKQSKLEKIEKFKKIEKLNVSPRKKYSENEKLYLSRQQIDDYFTCPKKYYFVSILKIPLPTDWHFMYGNAIHETLQRYFMRKQKGDNPDLQSLLSDFETYFKNEGFITRQHEEQRYALAIKTLTKFFDNDKIANLMPDKIEEKFEFAEDGVKINGRYDLVINNGKDKEIIDFKTSNVNDQKDADRRIRESTQMKIYALAWLEKFGEIPKTTLFFIENDLKGSRQFSEKELDKTKEMIFEVADGIRKNDLKAKPDVRQCGMCPFKDICSESAS